MQRQNAKSTYINIQFLLYLLVHSYNQPVLSTVLDSTTSLLPPTKAEVNAFALVRLSACLLARLLKNACMDLDEMLCVDRCRDVDELINF